MPSIVIPNVAQVVMGYLSAGEPCENVYHVFNNGGWSAGELTTLLVTFQEWEAASAAPLRSEDVSLIRATATDLTSLTSARRDVQLPTPIPGEVAFPVLPSNATLAVKANIGERGRGRNGRTFWIGLAEPQVSGNTVDTAVAGNIVTALNDLKDALLTENPDWVLSIAHTVADGLPLEPGTSTPIVDWVVTDLTVDSQRDRLPGHKRHKAPTP